MSQKKLKLADIAALAGVSKSTVSFVLNGHAEKHRINQETVEKVQRIARQHNYKPSVYARALKSKKTYTMGLVIPDLANMGFANIAKALEKLLRENGYQLLIASSNDEQELEKQVVQGLLERQVDMLLVASAMPSEEFYYSIKKSTPVIFFDRTFHNSQFINVKTDAYSATKQLVARMIQGVDECVYIGGQRLLSPSQERLEGYQAGLEQVGVTFNEAMVFNRDYQPQSGYDSMAEAMARLGRPPQALFAASYSLLEGVLRYLTEHQLLNDTIRLGTFDNYAILDCLPVKIDSIEQDSESIAMTLCQIALDLFNDPSRPAETFNIAAKIHFRRDQ
ncbi:LacI family DNA-binding transcriptional regulator [Vibrio fluminensis]|uniref:LacI family DNA-binding transcriptional regulator n=1 Tax=Vibrio fluminensis TaxID=2783614 RepID=UPI00188935D1|nr:LacI family DNA-binding transcriptional regulator [Vibrio fluminensis]